MLGQSATRKSLLKLLLWVGGAIIVVCAAWRIYYAATDDFRLANIREAIPYKREWEVEAPSRAEEEALRSILSQQFHYLGKGAQSYAFASEDGRYVIKFFKFKHLRPSWFVDALPAIGPLKGYKERLAARKARKLFGVFSSYKLAYDVDREESALVFIQLNGERNPGRSVTVVDKIGRSHTIALESIPFILQWKGETLRTILARALHAGDVELAKERLGQIFDLYAHEYSKGIYDHDHGVMQNTGFIGSRPLHLDVGKLLEEPQARTKEWAAHDASRVAHNITAWIEKHYPQYSEEVKRYIDGKLCENFQ